MSVLLSQRVLPWWPSAFGRIAASLPLWCALATAMVVLATLIGDAGSLVSALGDTDDAVRLVAVRELMAGTPWFDATLPRIGAPDPLVSHWSRLIDAPLALLIGLLSPLLGPDQAELATRVIWPAGLLFALLLIVAREADRQAGAWAAAFALLLAATSLTALFQFKPGRIDHHNVQILCVVGGLIFLARSLTDARLGWVAGTLLGAGLAVGYEAIALTVPAAALAALVAVWRPDRAGGVVRAAFAATAVMTAALVLTVPPWRWLDIACDALSLNLPIIGLVCSTGLWAATAMIARPAARLAVLGGSALVGAALYAGLEPACLRGPFGQVNPALGPVWLNQVMEAKSLVWLAGNHPAVALSYLAFALAGAAAQIALWRARPEPASALAAAVMSLAALLGCWQIKLMPYASWLAVLPLAVFAARLGPVGSLSPWLVRIAAVVLISQATLYSGFDVVDRSLRWMAGIAPAQVPVAEVTPACAQGANLRPLSALPAGLVAANIDLGPHLVAFTPHRVVAAPYHRLDKGILANQAILEGQPAQALGEIEALHVDYLVLCADPGAKPAPPREARTLRARLLAGEAFSYLQPIAMPSGSPIKVWRILGGR